MINFQLRLFGLDLLSLFASTDPEPEYVQYADTGGQFELAEAYDIEDTGEEFGFHA